VAAVSSEQRGRFVRLIHRGLELHDFLHAADRSVATLVPFDSSCWLSLDPATLLPTSHFTHQIGTEHLLELAANEFMEDDVNKFVTLARAAQPVAILSEATSGDLESSPRYVRVLAPHGYERGDELRAVFRSDEAVWGCVALHRRDRRFAPAEAELVANVTEYIAEGIRRAILLGSRQARDEVDGPGLLVLRSDGSIESANESAERWMSDMLDSTTGGGHMPLLVASVASKARRAAAGQSNEIAQARVPRRTGGWLLLHGMLLNGGEDERVAVLIQPAKDPEIASLIVAAYRLTGRERDVTRLVLQGCSTAEIADRLRVSRYTVQDYLKSIFTKVGVRSRRELIARLFLQQYAPRLEARMSVAANGWFDEINPPGD
jgi:DNA-binding CsgD family transcriptional regulator